MKKKGIQKAIDFFGSQSAMAEAVGVNRVTVAKWVAGKSKISPARAIKVVELCEGKVKLNDLRPDLWD